MPFQLQIKSLFVTEVMNDERILFKERHPNWIDWIWERPLVVKTGWVVICLYLVMILSLESAPPFIYFQF